MINTGVDFLFGHLVSSILFLIIGLHYWVNQPKKYEVPPEYNLPSKMTQLNEDTWKESFQYSGKIMSKASTTLLLIGLLFSYLTPTNNLSRNQVYGLNLILMIIVMMFIALTVSVMTETHLEKIFDRKGNRKKL